jgi:cytochrome c2
MTGKRQLSIVVAAIAAMVAGAAVAAAAENGKPDPMQIARGAKAWSDNCGRCHNFRDPKEFSDKNWDVIVNHMRVIAPLPGATARDIKVFLQSSN